MVLDSFRDDIHLTRPEGDGTVSQFDFQCSEQHQEEVVGIIVFAPDKLTLGFCEHHVMPVEFANRFGRKIVGE